MFYLGLVFALALPGFLPPQFSLSLLGLICVGLLIGRLGLGAVAFSVVFCIQLGRVTFLAADLWPQDFRATIRAPVQLLSESYSQGQGYGEARIIDGPYAGRIQLGWSVMAWRPMPGEVWSLPLKVKGIAVTPSARDMAFAQMSKQIRGRARVQRGGHERLSAAPLNFVVRKRWLDSLKGASQAGQWLGAGMLLGQKPDWGQSRQAALETSGLGHLFSPSGLHLAMAVGLLSALTPSWSQFVGGAIRRRGMLLMGVAGVVWALPTKLPIIRSFIGFVLWWCNQSPRRWDVSALWAVCLSICLVIWPAASGSSGTWLSFGAVGWILMCARAGVSRARKAAGMLLGLSSLSVLMGMGAGLFSVISNAVWVPLVGMLGAPALVFGLATDLWWPWSAFSDGLLGYLSWLPHYSLSWAQGCLMGVSALAMVWPIASLGGLLCVPLLMQAPAQGLWLYSVGAGQAARLSAGAQHWMIDAAPAQPGRLGAVGWEAIPSFRKQGIRHLDRVLLSHGDADHAGGFAALDARFEVGQLLTGEPSRTDGAACFAGQRWQWDQIEVHVHWGGPPGIKNSASCVVEIKVPAGSIWILGDAPREEQWRLARAQRQVAPTDIVVAAHHGARDGFSSDIGARQQPKHVVFSQAKLGRWQHPHPEVEAGWQALGASTWRLGSVGTLYIDLNSTELTPHPLHSASYWTRVSRKNPAANYVYYAVEEDPA